MKILTTEVSKEKIIEIYLGGKTSIEKEHELKELLNNLGSISKEEEGYIHELVEVAIWTIKFEDRVKYLGLKELLDNNISRYENILTENVDISKKDRELLRYVYVDERGYFHIYSNKGWLNPALEKISGIKVKDNTLTLMVEDENGLESEKRQIKN